MTPPPKGRQRAVATAAVTIVGLNTWDQFDQGHTARGWLLITLFAGLPAAAAMIRRLVARHAGIRPAESLTPAEARYRHERRWLTGTVTVLAVIGAVAIAEARHGDRFAVSIIVGIALIIAPLLYWPRR